MDPTLGIVLSNVRSANDQEPVVINPATWAAYGEIKPVGELPGFISRNDLVEQADGMNWGQPDAEAVRRLFVLVMMWGSGKTNGRGPRNTASALASKNSTQTLIEAHTLLSVGDIDAAYYLHRRLVGIGPSFHTKWLWLLGRATEVKPQPLILDERVWSSLSQIGWDSRRAADGVRLRGRRYVAYLEACARWARQARGRTPEDVEYTLFSGGG